MFIITGKFLYRIRVLLFIIFQLAEVAPLSAQQEVRKVYALSDESSFRLVTENPYSIKISYSIGQIEISGITNQNGTFYRLAVPGHHSLSDPGKPELPVISTLISVPEYSGVKITYSNLVTRKINPGLEGIRGVLYPAQPGQTKSKTQQQPKFIIDAATYLRSGFTKTDTILLDYAGEMRGEKLATLSLLPVHYDPLNNSLEIIVSVDVNIEFQPLFSGKVFAKNEVEATDAGITPKGSKSFPPDQLINGYSEYPAGLVILTDTAFRKQIQPLVQWKTQKGFRVTTLYRGTTLAGQTNTELRDTLKKLYLAGTETSPAAEYLLIIGDLSVIPKSPSLSGSTNLSDLYYGEFTEGGDFIPEMFIGRLPAKDTAGVRSVVNKILQYEKFEFADTNTFYKNALITAGNDASHATFMNGQINYASQNYINPANLAEPVSFLYPVSADMDDSVKIILNKGIGFMNYTGHGAADQWDDPLFTFRNADSLKNKNMYPFVVSNACHTAQFDLNENLATSFVMNRNGGAIGFIGCSNFSYWDEDYFYAVGATSVSLNPEYLPDRLGFYDRLFHLNGELPSQWYYTMGQVNFAGNLAVTASTTARKRYYWETYHLLGDPSLMPMIGIQSDIVSNLPDTLPVGIKSLYITAPPFSYAAVSNWDTLWDASFISPSGYASLTIPENTADSCLVVITGQNRKPLIKTIYFGEVAGSYISADSFMIKDISGNDNGKADYGESLYIGMSLSNPGGAASIDAYARITSASEWVTILDDSAFIGVIPSGGSATIEDAFKISVSSSVPNFGIISFIITIYENSGSREYIHDMVVLAPVVSISSVRIDDIPEGNGNLLPDRSEIVNLIFTVRNTGMSAAEGIFSITNIPDGIDLDVSEKTTGIIEPGSFAEITLRGTISSSLVPGDRIELDALVNCGSYQDAKSFTISVGKTIESFESGDFTIFPWQNVSPIPWLITGTEAFDGYMSAISGVIGHNGKTTLQINIDIPESDTVRFWYKVSSEASYDILRFSVDGTEKFKASGEIGWTQKEVILEPGRHLLDWSYSKDGSVSTGSDRAWIDMIEFPPSSFAERDIALSSILSPAIKDEYGLEEITVVVRNMGSNQINGFYLACSVSDIIQHEWQYFSNTIPVRDSVVVSFAQRLDMSKLSIYDIAVYGFDNDDDFVLNDTIRIRIENTKMKTDFTAYPNPFRDEIKLFIRSSVEETVTISINNVAGKVLETYQTVVINGDNTIPIIPGPMPSGIYIIRIKGKLIDARVKVFKL